MPHFWSRERQLTALLLAPLPWLWSKPVHVDEANFLRLAAGARADPWRPHEVLINWQGQTERAFEVLSNPPGIAWWLSLLGEAPIWLLRASLLPWLLLALWGAEQLGRHWTPARSGWVVPILLSTPVVLWASHSLTPDLPLLACTLAGIGGLMTRPRVGPWALLAGCAALFRYSGLCLIPLVLLLALQRGRRFLAPAALVTLPSLALLAHDLSAYGSWHALAMTSFQSVSGAAAERAHKGLAALSMLGGTTLLALLLRGRLAAAGLGLGLLAGVAAGQHEGMSWPGSLWLGLACGSGAALMSSTLRGRSPRERSLLAWAGGGLVFLLLLRFTATRYWLPFLPAVVLAALRSPRSPRALGALALGQGLLGWLLCWDDLRWAQSHQEAARAVEDYGQGSFSGHWGWQHHLEAAGWTPLEEGGSPLAFHAEALRAWPQEPAEDSCLEPVSSWPLPSGGWGLRLHSPQGRANFHASFVSDTPALRSYLPWTLSSEPYDVIRLWRSCDLPSP